MRQYKQLTQEQRYCIYVLKQAQFSNRSIAKQIKVHHSTVCRELIRNTHAGYKVYRYGTAQRLSTERRRKCRKLTVLSTQNRFIIGDKLRKHWSPEQISGWLRRHEILNISHQSIYNYIRSNQANGGKLYKYLRRKRKYRKRYCMRPGIVDRVSIDERPKEVDLKQRIGDWEVDTIVSRQHKDVLVTMVERYSKFALVGKAESKQANRVAKIIRNLLSRKREKALTITSDNGTEFARHKLVSKWLDVEYYFCHPHQ